MQVQVEVDTIVYWSETSRPEHSGAKRVVEIECEHSPNPLLLLRDVKTGMRMQAYLSEVRLH